MQRTSHHQVRFETGGEEGLTKNMRSVTYGVMAARTVGQSNWPSPHPRSGQYTRESGNSSMARARRSTPC